MKTTFLYSNVLGVRQKMYRIWLRRRRNQFCLTGRPKERLGERIRSTIPDTWNQRMQAQWGTKISIHMKNLKVKVALKYPQYEDHELCRWHSLDRVKYGKSINLLTLVEVSKACLTLSLQLLLELQLTTCRTYLTANIKRQKKRQRNPRCCK